MTGPLPTPSCTSNAATGIGEPRRRECQRRERAATGPARSLEAQREPPPHNAPNIKVFAKVASNHDWILKKDFKAVADAVSEVADLGDTNR